jgi:hypothetical protein
LTIDDRTFEIAYVYCTDQDLVVSLKDGRKIVAPALVVSSPLQAPSEQRRHWEIAGAGRGIHWPDVDEDLSLEGIFRGATAPGAKRPEPAWLVRPPGGFGEAPTQPRR